MRWYVCVNFEAAIEYQDRCPINNWKNWSGTWKMIHLFTKYFVSIYYEPGPVLELELGHHQSIY